jgi:hypothetical protein
MSDISSTPGVEAEIPSFKSSVKVTSGKSGVEFRFYKSPGYHLLLLDQKKELKEYGVTLKSLLACTSQEADQQRNQGTIPSNTNNGSLLRLKQQLKRTKPMLMSTTQQNRTLRIIFGALWPRNSLRPKLLLLHPSKLLNRHYNPSYTRSHPRTQIEDDLLWQ